MFTMLSMQVGSKGRPIARDLPSPPSSASRPVQMFPLLGERIEVYGTSRHDINGKRGVATDANTPEDLKKHDPKGWRYTVRSGSGKGPHLSPVNSATRSPPGGRYRHPAHHGQHQHCGSLSSEAAQCSLPTPLQVELDSGEVFKVRRDAVRAEPAASSGARTEAKGKVKGKKKRAGQKSK